MIRRSTWITLGAFVLVLLAAVLINRQAEAPAEPDGPQPTPTATLAPLWTFRSAEIEALEIDDRERGLQIELRRDADAGWLVVEPEGIEADVAQIEAAVSWMDAPVASAELPLEDNLADFGLAEPRALITVHLADEETLTLTVGREAPTGGSMYVMVPDRDAVLVVSSFGLSDLLALPETLLATPTPEVSETPQP